MVRTSAKFWYPYHPTAGIRCLDCGFIGHNLSLVVYGMHMPTCNSKRAISDRGWLVVLLSPSLSLLPDSPRHQSWSVSPSLRMRDSSAYLTPHNIHKFLIAISGECPTRAAAGSITPSCGCWCVWLALTRRTISHDVESEAHIQNCHR